MITRSCQLYNYIIYNKTFPNWNSITTWLSNAGSVFSFCSLNETESGNFDKYSVHMYAIYVVIGVIEQAKKIGQYADAFLRSSLDPPRENSSANTQEIYVVNRFHQDSTLNDE